MPNDGAFLNLQALLQWIRNHRHLAETLPHGRRIEGKRASTPGPWRRHGLLLVGHDTSGACWQSELDSRHW
jgi:hypothetical protein